MKEVFYMRVIVYQASDTSALSKKFNLKKYKCHFGCPLMMVYS